MNQDRDFNRINVFTDETTFSRRGITDVYNNYFYAIENNHALVEKHFKQGFK